MGPQVDKTAPNSTYQQCRALVQDLLKNLVCYIRNRIGASIHTFFTFSLQKVLNSTFFFPCVPFFVLDPPTDFVSFLPLFGPSLSATKEFDTSTAAALRSRPPSLAVITIILENLSTLLADSITRQKSYTRDLSQTEDAPLALDIAEPDALKYFQEKQNLRGLLEKEKLLTLSLLCKAPTSLLSSLVPRLPAESLLFLLPPLLPH